MSPAERSVASGSGPSAPSGAPAAASMTPVGGPTRILLVEDEENFRDPLAYGLRRDGFEVVEAEDGQRAVEIFEASRRPGGIGPIDLVLLDLMLPRLDGTEEGRKLYEEIAGGYIDRMSFAFTVREEGYDEEDHLWTIQKVKRLYDVSAVDIPAYDDTSIAARRAAVEDSQRAHQAALALDKRKIALKCKL